MIKQFLLNEDKLPPKLPVIFSNEIIDKIQDIRFYNQFDKEGLSRLFSYIKSVENHISNRSIAFSYGSDYTMDSNETIYVHDYGVIFCLVDYSDTIYVKVVWMDLNPKDFGLNENRYIDKIITEVIRQNTTNEFVSVTKFHYKGKKIDDEHSNYLLGNEEMEYDDAFCYCPCDIYGTPKLYYSDNCNGHIGCADQSLDDILKSFGYSIYDCYDNLDIERLTRDLWAESKERGRVFFRKYIVVGEDGHMPSNEYVSKVIEYMGGSPKEYYVLYNENNKVIEIPCDVFLRKNMGTNIDVGRLYVPKEIKEFYDEVMGRRRVINKKFPSNITRAEYYWLTRQESRKINKIVIETINQYLKQNLILN